MKEFREEKQQLELKIFEMIREFCDKYNVSVFDIEFNPYMTYDGTISGNVNIEIKL